MQKFLYSLTVMLFVSSIAIGQTDIDPVYGSKEKDLTDYKSIVEIFDPNYVTTYVNGVAIKSNVIDGILVSLSLEPDYTAGIKKHFTIMIEILNNSGERFNFSEENMEGYYRYKDRYGKLERYDYKVVEKKLKKAKTWSDIGRGMNEAADSYNENMAYTSKTEVKVKDNTGKNIGSAQINTRDNSQINSNRADRQAALNSVDNEERQYIRETVNEYLKINTIHNDDQFFSFIYFDRPKTDKVWITVNILGREYIFDWDTID